MSAGSRGRVAGGASGAPPTRPSPSRSNVSTALIRAPWSGTEISCRKLFPHSGHVHVAQDSLVVFVAASRRTRRIVSTSSAAVSASAGRTADGRADAGDVSSRGSFSAITRNRPRAFRLFVWPPFTAVSRPTCWASRAWCSQRSPVVDTDRHLLPSRSVAAQRGVEPAMFRILTSLRCAVG